MAFLTRMEQDPYRYPCQAIWPTITDCLIFRNPPRTLRLITKQTCHMGRQRDRQRITTPGRLTFRPSLPRLLHQLAQHEHAFVLVWRVYCVQEKLLLRPMAYRVRCSS